MSNKDILLWIIKIFISLALIWYLFYSGNLSWNVFFKLIDPVNLVYLFSASLAFCTAQVLASARLVYLLKIVDIKMSFLDALRLTMIGNFFNLVIPGAIGGDVVKGYYLASVESNQKGRSAGILITDRLLGLIALLLIGCISLAYLFRTSSFVFKMHHSIFLLILCIGVTVCFLLVSFFFISRRKLIREKIKKIALRVFKGGFFYFIIEGLGLVTKKRRYILLGITISVLVQIICLLGLVLIAGIDGNREGNRLALIAVSSIVMLLGVVPVSPGNIGWTELMATYGWAAVGGSGGAEVFLFWRIVTMVCSLPGAFYYLFMDRKRLKGLY